MRTHDPTASEEVGLKNAINILWQTNFPQRSSGMVPQVPISVHKGRRSKLF